VTEPINLNELRERYQPQTGKDVDCPLCGEGYPATYPHGIDEASAIVLALIDTAEAAIAIAPWVEPPTRELYESFFETLGRFTSSSRTGG
jgi:hypothetical protein